MSGRLITELKNCHQGADIWVIASGPSAGYIDPEFFRRKITIGVNRVWGRFRTTYICLKESDIVDQAIATGSIVVASEYNCGAKGYRKAESAHEFYYFEHLENGIQEVDLSVVGSDCLVVSFSTITSAMHLAAYMGAANIILVGHDCGFLDGQRNYEGYPHPMMQAPGFYERFLARIEPQSVNVREKLQEVYGCRIYSLNPFLNFRLEGHRYESASNT